jgi:hypothetical protein
MIAADARHLGARIGITAFLHTWGSAMTHHPHVRFGTPHLGTRQQLEMKCYNIKTYSTQRSWASLERRGIVANFALAPAFDRCRRASVRALSSIGKCCWPSASGNDVKLIFNDHNAAIQVARLCSI